MCLAALKTARRSKPVPVRSFLIYREGFGSSKDAYMGAAVIAAEID